jgi:hypothetical protein
MNELLGHTVAIVGADTSGVVVGVESVDPSKHGNGKPRPYVCVHSDDQLFWEWHPLTSVQFTQGEQ